MRRPWLVLISRESIQGRSPATASASAHLLDSLAADGDDHAMQLVAKPPIRPGVSVARRTLTSRRRPVKEELRATTIDEVVAAHPKMYSSESMF
jgi:hypothetical protein